VHLGANQQTASIGHNMTLTAFDLLGGVVTTRPAALGCLDRLTVDHPGRRACIGARRFARLQRQLKIDLLEEAIMSPIVEITSVVAGGESFGSIRH
jgi:phage gpG-like protein